MEGCHISRNPGANEAHGNNSGSHLNWKVVQPNRKHVHRMLKDLTLGPCALTKEILGY